MSFFRSRKLAPITSDFLLECKDLVRHYGKIKPVDGVSLNLRPHELLSILGPSGCGKEYIATQFAQMLNCEQISGEICRVCSSCKRAKNLQHENINLVFPLPAIKKGSNNKDNEIENSNLDIVTDSIKKKSRNQISFFS